MDTPPAQHEPFRAEVRAQPVQGSSGTMGKAEQQESGPPSDQSTLDDQDDALARVREEFRVSLALEAADAELGTAVSELQGAARAHASANSSRSLLGLMRAAFNLVVQGGGPATR